MAPEATPEMARIEVPRSLTARFKYLLEQRRLDAAAKHKLILAISAAGKGWWSMAVLATVDLWAEGGDTALSPAQAKGLETVTNEMLIRALAQLDGAPLDELGALLIKVQRSGH